MKKILIILVSCLFICCSENDKIIVTPNSYSAQEYYDKVIKHNVVKDSAGHTLIFHEVGKRGCRNYSFSIEHSPECKLCCEIYD